MSMERLPFEHRPRNSIANNLDRINELIDWVNLDTHLYASASGERVTVDDASSVKGLTVDGRSVQDGTPTPDAPVPVQVLDGKNLLPLATQTVTNRGVTATVDDTGTVTITGTATGGNAALTIPVASDVPLANSVDYTAQRITVSGSLDGTFYVRGIDDANQTIHHLFNLASVTNRTSSFTNNAIMQAVYIVVSENTTIDCVLHVQVEQGSTATPYVPYGSIDIVVGDTATSINLQGNKLASLPDGTHDELHIDSAGHVTVEKLVALLDSTTGETWSTSGQINNAGLSVMQTDVEMRDGIRQETVSRYAFSNIGIQDTNFSNTVVEGFGANSSTASRRVYWRYDPGETAPSVANGIERMAELGANLYYPRLNPVTIDLGYIDPPAIPSGSVVTISASLTPEFHLEWWVDDGITALVDDLIAYVDYKTEG